MTLYVNEEYYISTFGGTMLTNSDIRKYLELAQEKIDSITFNRIVKIGFDKLTDFQKEKISKAICYQAEYIFENGFNDEDKEDVASYSVLDISINTKSKSIDEKTEAEKNYMSEIAMSLVDKTGLNCRKFNGFYY